MNSDEFIMKAHEEQNCPNNFDEIYKEFQVYQALAFDTLREFHRVCELNSVPYCLIDGSLLGAIRDHGQIPWDYDVDVLVPFAAKNALQEALRNDLKSDYYFISPDTNSHYKYMLLRVCPKGYRSDELHVDVFFFFGAPQNKVEHEKIMARVEKICWNRYAKNVNAKYGCRGNFVHYIYLLYKKMLTIGANTDKDYEELKRYAEMYPIKYHGGIIRCDQYNTHSINGEKVFFDYHASDLVETKLIYVGTDQFRVPVGYDRFLHETYGDYMKTPQMPDCIAEMLSHYEKLSKYAKGTDVI